MKKNIFRLNHIVIIAFFFTALFLFSNNKNISVVSAQQTGYCVQQVENGNNKVNVYKPSLSKEECELFKYTWTTNYSGVDTICYQIVTTTYEKVSGKYTTVYALVDCSEVKTYLKSDVKIEPLTINESTYNKGICANDNFTCYEGSSYNYNTSRSYMIEKDPNTNYLSCYNQNGEMISCNTNDCQNGGCYDRNADKIGSDRIYYAKDCYDYLGNLVDCLIGPKSENKDLLSFVFGSTFKAIIWSLLGGILLLRGSYLGVEIVKHADEPDVRKQKIGHLKHLLIGIAAIAILFLVGEQLYKFFDKTVDSTYK